METQVALIAASMSSTFLQSPVAPLWGSGQSTLLAN